jgi:hypothetical protein
LITGSKKAKLGQKDLPVGAVAGGVAAQVKAISGLKTSKLFNGYLNHIALEDNQFILARLYENVLSFTKKWGNGIINIMKYPQLLKNCLKVGGCLFS